MSAVPAIRLMSVAEYLQMEDASTEKHEYFGGEVFAMAGASFAHNQISSNTQGEIYQFLKGKSCRIYGSDLKVHVKTNSAFVYPDLTIICGNPEFLEGRNDIVVNPTVIIEVLSPETKNFDRGEKFMFYRQIPSLKEYLLLSSMEMLAEKFVREASGGWMLTEYRNPDDTIVIEAIDYTTTLREVYRDVVFENS